MARPQVVLGVGSAQTQNERPTCKRAPASTHCRRAPASYSPRCAWHHLRVRCLHTARAFGLLSPKPSGAADAPRAPPSAARSHHACLPFRRHCVQVHRTAHGDRRDHCWYDLICTPWRSPWGSFASALRRCCGSARAHAAGATAPGTHVRLMHLKRRHFAGSQRPRAVAPLPDWQQRQGIAVRPAKPHAAALPHAHAVLQRPVQHPQVRADVRCVRA